ncbi:MAG: hypothetical protein KDB63_22275 [Nocardioidaceae bacterium]|nr:hypothetical protein [Nocardioidaceae bacterium]
MVAPLQGACSEGAGPVETSSTRPSATSSDASAPDPAQEPGPDGAVRILFLGNSHTARNDVPGTVEGLWRSLDPAADVRAVLGPGSLHLDDRGDDPATLDAIASQPWDFVVLQAQNYSLSGCCHYPTTAAEKLVRLARAQGATPVLYAEWARRGIDETALILRTYGRIAAHEPACLPPVPESFRIALRHDPDLVLLSDDGNHAAPAGSYLAAAVLTAAMSGEPASMMSDLGGVDVEPRVQAELRAMADEAMGRLVADRRC